MSPNVGSIHTCLIRENTVAHKNIISLPLNYLQVLRMNGFNWSHEGKMSYLILSINDLAINRNAIDIHSLYPWGNSILNSSIR